MVPLFKNIRTNSSLLLTRERGSEEGRSRAPQRRERSRSRGGGERTHRSRSRTRSRDRKRRPRSPTPDRRHRSRSRERRERSPEMKYSKPAGKTKPSSDTVAATRQVRFVILIERDFDWHCRFLLIFTMNKLLVFRLHLIC